jgi:hypothetical protein
VNHLDPGPPSHVGGHPYQVLKTTGVHGTLDWQAVTELLQPQRQQQRPQPRPAPDPALDGLAGWVAAQPVPGRALA